ncbi:hypothetical protein D3C83_262650 [compost metagenome]
MIDGHPHELRQVVEFTAHVRVVQIHVTFTPAPENVILAAQPVSDFNRLLDL